MGARSFPAGGLCMTILFGRIREYRIRNTGFPMIFCLSAKAKTQAHLIHCYRKCHKYLGHFMEKPSVGIKGNLFLTQNYLQTLFHLVLQLDSSLCRSPLLRNVPGSITKSCTIAGITTFTQERDF